MSVTASSCVNLVAGAEENVADNGDAKCRALFRGVFLATTVGSRWELCPFNESRDVYARQDHEHRCTHARMSACARTHPHPYTHLDAHFQT